MRIQVWVEIWTWVLQSCSQTTPSTVVFLDQSSLDDRIFDFLYAIFVQRGILPPELYFTLSLIWVLKTLFHILKRNVPS